MHGGAISGSIVVAGETTQRSFRHLPPKLTASSGVLSRTPRRTVSSRMKSTDDLGASGRRRRLEAEAHVSRAGGAIREEVNNAMTEVAAPVVESVATGRAALPCNRPEIAKTKDPGFAGSLKEPSIGLEPMTPSLSSRPVVPVRCDPMVELPAKDADRAESCSVVPDRCEAVGCHTVVVLRRCGRSLLVQSGQAKVRIGGTRIRRKAIVRAVADSREQRDRLVAHALVG